MFHHCKFLAVHRTPATTALDAGATIQDALVRRLRLEHTVAPDEREHPVIEDRAPIAAVVGRKRYL